MNRTLYIHIGAPKTGSTALQLFLEQNREALRERLFLYPRAGCRAGGHHDLAFLLSGGYPEWAIAQEAPLEEIWSGLEREARSDRGDIILDSENFYLYPAPMRLAERLATSDPLGDCRVRILAYLRPQEEMVESWYNQTVKAQGSVSTFAESMERDRPLWDYDARLKAWADVFGRENVLVRRYVGAAASADIRADFLSWLSIDEQGLVFAETRPNTKLNRDLLEFQRTINALPLSAVEKRTFHKRLIQLAARTAGSGLFVESPFLSAYECHLLRAYYEESNRRVARDYLGGGELFAPPRPSEESPLPTQALRPEALASILGWLLIQSR